MCQTELGRFEDAQATLRDAFDTVETAYGPDHERTLDAVHRLAVLYKAWNRPDDLAREEAFLREHEKPNPSESQP